VPEVRIRFVTDGFDGAGPENAPEFAQIAFPGPLEQKAFRRALVEASSEVEV